MKIDTIEDLAEREKFPQQPERRPLNLQNLRRLILRSSDCGAAGDARQNRHLAEVSARRYFRDLYVFATAISEQDLRLPFNHTVKSIASPIAFTDHGLTRIVSQQTHIRPDLFSLVVPAVYDHFKVELIFEVTVFHGHQVGQRRQRSDRIENFTAAFV